MADAGGHRRLAGYQLVDLELPVTETGRPRTAAGVCRVGFLRAEKASPRSPNPVKRMAMARLMEIRLHLMEKHKNI